MKLWIKTIIIGIIIFFIGAFYITAMGGNIAKNPEGMLISLIGGIVVVFGLIFGLRRLGRRMMSD